MQLNYLTIGVSEPRENAKLLQMLDKIAQKTQVAKNFNNSFPLFFLPAVMGFLTSPWLFMSKSVQTHK